MSDLHVVIMAAGKGTRMNDPQLPKVMVELAGRPMIARVLDRAIELNAATIIPVIGYRGEVVRDYLARKYADSRIELAEQTEQLGTAHAVMQAMPYLEGESGDVLVLSGDVPMITIETLRNLVEHHRAHKAAMTMLTVEVDDPHGYGRVVRGHDGTVTMVVEQKDADTDQEKIREINAGIYLFRKELLEEMLPRVGNENANGEFYLPDVLGLAINAGRRCEAYLSQDASEIRGINDREQLAAAEESISA